MYDTLAQIVALGAEVRGDPPVDRKFIDEAVSAIERGEFKVKTFPSGMLDPLAVFHIATELEAKANSKH